MRKSVFIFFILFSILYVGIRGPLAEGAQDTRKELSLHYYRGVVNFEAGHYENAMAEFRTVIAIDPYYKDTQTYIQKCMKVLEQNRQEMLASTGESSLDNQGFDYYFLGKSLYEKGDYRKALEAFKAVLAKNPNDKFALYYVQLCQEALPGGLSAAKGKAKGKKEAAGDLEKEVVYVKGDINEQKDT